MGLAEGNFDVAAIGCAALADQPAFYDPTTGKIYELREHVAGAARHRRVAGADDGAHRPGVRLVDSPRRRRTPPTATAAQALFDGYAAASPAETTAATLVDPAGWPKRHAKIGFLRVAAMDDAASASPFGVALVRSGAEATTQLFAHHVTDLERNRPTRPSSRATPRCSTAHEDSTAFPPPSCDPASKTVGMMYWVLRARRPDRQ